MIEQITTLFRLCYPGIVRSEGSVRRTLSHEENHILKRFDGDALVGAAVYYDDRILMLCVHPEYRGRGYGKALLKQLAKIAVERGCGRLEWWCLDWNAPSIDFYKSMGAVPMDEWTTFRIAGETLTDLANS